MCWLVKHTCRGEAFIAYDVPWTACGGPTPSPPDGYCTTYWAWYLELSGTRNVDLDTGIVWTGMTYGKLHVD